MTDEIVAYMGWGISAQEQIDGLRREVRELKAENARLRELVEDMLSCIEIRSAFGRPPTDEMHETFARRARELGVNDG